MKRSLGTAEIANVRRVVPVTTEDSDSPAEPASDAPALAALPETAPSEHPPMAFPGPYAFFPKPAAMQDGAKTSASTSSAETVTDTENPKGFPPLILAASMGKLAELEILLQDPALDINQCDPKTGRSAMMAAAEGGHIAVLARLITAGADLDLQEPGNGSTVLILAAYNNRPDVVAWLLDAGAKVNLAVGEEQYTALMIAVGEGHIEVVKKLLAHKDIALDQTDATGCNALYFASCTNQLGVIACLLDAGADVNLASGEYRSTALMLATDNGHVEVVKTLLTCKDIALDQTDAGGYSALLWAANKNQHEIVACLLSAGAKVNLVNGTSRTTALIAAACLGHVEIVETLLTCKDIALDQNDVQGSSALIYAAFSNKPKMMACLLKAGASMTVANRSGRTAVAIAIGRKHTAVLEVLVQHGADLPGFQHVDPAQAASDVAFAVTVADLDADRKSPADPENNPLGLAAPDSMNDPLAVIDELLAVLELKQDLQQWLRAKGIRMACALPVIECLASLTGTWPVLANNGRTASTLHKRLVCAAALGRLSAMTADEKALQHYKAAGISAAGLERLSAVATRQIEKMIAVSDEVLTTFGSDMLENLMPDCLASTSLANQVNTETMIANLNNAGWRAPLAQAIVTSWKSALATLEAEPLATAPGSTMQQITQGVLENIQRQAPQPFAVAMQRELAAQTLLAALRTWIGATPSAEGLDMLFQVQCDQLRQYCEHMLNAR